MGQGSLLSPSLFRFYVRDLIKITVSSRIARAQLRFTSWGRGRIGWSPNRGQSPRKSGEGSGEGHGEPSPDFVGEF